MRHRAKNCWSFAAIATLAKLRSIQSSLRAALKADRRNHHLGPLISGLGNTWKMGGAGMGESGLMIGPTGETGLMKGGVLYRVRGFSAGVACRRIGRISFGPFETRYL
jgi:hypothetical protein